MRPSIRHAALLLVLVLAAACAAPITESPALTPEAEAELSARGLALLCDQHCVGGVVYVSDHEYETVSPPVPGEPLTETQTRAITRQFTNVEFLEEEEAHAIHAEAGVVFVVGPVAEQSGGLVDVEVSAVGADSVFTEVFPFGWDGDGWVPSNSGESNVTVSTLD